MKLSKKSRYGLRALIDLAVNSRTELVSLGSIAQRNDISAQYLEHVFSSPSQGSYCKKVWKGSLGRDIFWREIRKKSRVADL